MGYMVTYHQSMARSAKRSFSIKKTNMKPGLKLPGGPDYAHIKSSIYIAPTWDDALRHIIDWVGRPCEIIIETIQGECTRVLLGEVGEKREGNAEYGIEYTVVARKTDTELWLSPSGEEIFNK
jgi:hypothetical protein